MLRSCEITRFVVKKKVSILIIEDEEAIATGLADLFSFHGYKVEIVREGDKGLEKALSGEYDGIILDVMLPGIDGFSILEQIRAKNRSQPVVMLTAKSMEEDIINGLSLGADDYVAKPFSVRELVLRVEAVLRRSKKISGDRDELQFGNLTIDTRDLIGRNDAEREVQFTRREIDILCYLRLQEGRLVQRGELLSEVWGYDRAANIETRTVDIHIAKLRRKIEEDPSNPKYLVTVRGEGYRLQNFGWRAK